MNLRDGLVDPDTHHMDLDAYPIVGRLFANKYFTIADTFELAIPDVKRETEA